MRVGTRRLAGFWASLAAAASLAATARGDGTRKWAFTTYGEVISSPAVAADGTILVGCEDQAAASAGISSPAGFLFAVHPDGSLKWVFRAGDWIDSTPAIGPDGTIYAGSWDGHLYAINPANGQAKWSYSARTYVPTAYIYSSPAVGRDGTVYLGAGDNGVHAVNPDGSEKWVYLTGDWVDSSPAVGPDGTIYAGSWDNSLYAINPDGTLKWSFATGGNILGSPAISPDGIVYIASRDQNIYALTPGGNPIWNFTGDDAFEASPVVGPDGTIYIGSTNEAAAGNGKLYALSPNGTLKWSYVAGTGIFSTAAVRADGAVIVGTSNNQVLALSGAGQVLWQYSAGDYVDSSPLIAPDGTIYCGCLDYKLHAINGNGQAMVAASWPAFRHDPTRLGQLPMSAAFGDPGRLINLSSRAQVAAGANALAAGFVTSGAAKNLLLRGVGPALANFGVSSPVPDPVLALFNASSAQIDGDASGWSGSADLSSAMSQAGAFPFPPDSLDEALLESSLPPALYSEQVWPKASPGGVALAEIYDLDPAGAAGQLLNLSARANVAPGQNALVAGFVIGGSTAHTVLIRGVGPALANYGISSPLAQPTLTLYDQNLDILAQNTGWSTATNAWAIPAAASAVGAFALPSGSADCALLLTLPPGLYSAQITTPASPGVALAEVYLVP